eukprot:3919862-Rhodomonas_salina.1
MNNVEAACSISICCSRSLLYRIFLRQDRKTDARSMIFSSVREADASVGENHSQAITMRRNLCDFLLKNWREESTATFFAELNKLQHIISGEQGADAKDLIEVFYMMGVGEFHLGRYEKCLESFRRVDDLQATNPYWVPGQREIVNKSRMLECKGMALREEQPKAAAECLLGACTAADASSLGQDRCVCLMAHAVEALLRCEEVERALKFLDMAQDLLEIGFGVSEGSRRH